MTTKYFKRIKPDGTVVEYKREHSDRGLFEFVWFDGAWVSLDPPPLLGWMLAGHPDLIELDAPERADN